MPGRYDIRKFFQSGPTSAPKSARRSAPKKKRVTKKPSRMTGSRSRYSKNRSIARMLSNFSENKFNGTYRDCQVLTQKSNNDIGPGTNQRISYIFNNTGHDISGIVPAFSPGQDLNLYYFPLGDSSTERSGSYMYLKKTHMKINVQYEPQIALSADRADVTLNAPVQCRLMIVKANRKMNDFGQYPNPQGSLFIDHTNKSFGYGDGDLPVYLHMNQPINKRQWLVYMDKKFNLEPAAIRDTYANINEPTTTYGTTYSRGKLPTSRSFAIDLPCFKKTHFKAPADPQAPNLPRGENAPDNMDTQWLVILQVAHLNECFLGGSSTQSSYPEGVKMNIVATTSANDN